MQMNEQAIVRADDMKRPIPHYDFKASGEAIKEARKRTKSKIMVGDNKRNYHY